MKDWQGNEIKEDDEICFIQTKKGNVFSNAHFWIPSTGENISIPNEPESDCWEVGEYYKVKRYEFGLAFTKDYGNAKITMGIDGIDFGMSGSCLLGIKGKSDQKKLN